MGAITVKVKKTGGETFKFPSLPESISLKYGTRYQKYDILDIGGVEIPKGTDCEQITWEGEFFGKSKENEPIVIAGQWKEPKQCVTTLQKFIQDNTILRLIVPQLGIDMDTSISSFTPQAYGAYGNIKYSITFVRYRELQIKTAAELNIAAKVVTTKQDRPAPAPSGSQYTVVSGDTLWKIATKKLGGGKNWTKIYDANSAIIEATAKKHKKKSSDHGHWIWPGEVLTIPAS